MVLVTYKRIHHPSCNRSLDYMYTRIIKNILKNGIVCRDIKTEKAQEQDWDGTLATKLNLTTSTNVYSSTVRYHRYSIDNYYLSRVFYFSIYKIFIYDTQT